MQFPQLFVAAIAAASATVHAAANETASCASTTCLPTEDCVLQQVQCIRAPCPAIATCIPHASSTTATTQAASGCAPGLCGDSEVCELTQVQCFAAPCPAVPTCVPQKTTASCTKKCGRNQRCYLYNGAQYCADTCSGMRCKKSETCELQQVQCLVAPCPHVATCKASA